MRSTAERIAQPVNTFTAEVEESGTCHIPNVFADHYRTLSASLDWARVFNTSQDHHSTHNELRAAARAARALADQCDAFADEAVS